MADKKDTVTEEKPKRKKNYLNNKDMLAELRKCHEADEMTPEFANMITLLADRYGSKFEYADYSPHIEDMKAVAVMNVVRAWRSFDLEKYANPFAYFTQAIKHTFWQYVNQEKKHRLNRDHLLIANGELPSDAFMDDIEKEVTKGKIEGIMTDASKREGNEELYQEEYEDKKYNVLPEGQRPSDVVTIDVDTYLREKELEVDEEIPSIGIHSDILSEDSFDTYEE